MWCFWVKTFYEVFLFIFTVAVDFAMYQGPPFRAVPAAENIVTRCNRFTAGSSFHKMKTAEAAFKTFSFVPKILFTAVLLMQNCKRTENRIKSVKPIFTVRPSLNPTLSFPPRQRATLWNPGLFLRRWDFVPVFLCKFACGKLGADRGQIYVRKTNSSCPPRLVPLRSKIEPLSFFC